MLLIVILAFIATTAFYRQAKAVNVHPGKAASIPFSAAGLFLIAGYCNSFTLNTFATWVDVAPAIVHIMAFMANLFLTLAYLLLIRRNWLVLTTGGNTDSR
ncbi:hypothetical protein Rcae01_00076 [Novipirellula caenicola]|uniref:PQ loop repeat protein n=1 Tax=Novipirellula caenicola TaxID=1536901 RepID=A0ABP9VLS5_9BACT